MKTLQEKLELVFARLDNAGLNQQAWLDLVDEVGQLERSNRILQEAQQGMALGYAFLLAGDSAQAARVSKHLIRHYTGVSERQYINRIEK